MDISLKIRTLVLNSTKFDVGWKSRAGILNMWFRRGLEVVFEIHTIIVRK